MLQKIIDIQLDIRNILNDMRDKSSNSQGALPRHKDAEPTYTSFWELPISGKSKPTKEPTKR